MDLYKQWFNVNKLNLGYVMQWLWTNLCSHACNEEKSQLGLLCTHAHAIERPNCDFNSK